MLRTRCVYSASILSLSLQPLEQERLSHISWTTLRRELRCRWNTSLLLQIPKKYARVKATVFFGHIDGHTVNKTVSSNAGQESEGQCASPHLLTAL